MRALDLVNYLTLCEDWWGCAPRAGPQPRLHQRLTLQA